MFKLFNNKEITSVETRVETLITKTDRFDVKEAYNELRTNISFSIAKKECKVICTTSALASEGKSTTSVNNAITFAKSGKKILLIDCDLRKPNVNRLLELENEKGMSDVLVGAEAVGSVIKKDVFENFDVITSGPIPPNPVELLSSEQMSETISELRADYDYIFIDAPPINVVTDATIISKVTDGMIIVVRQHVAEKKLVADAVKKLQFVNAKIIGFVFNDVVVSKSLGYYKKGYGKYSYGGYSYGYGYGGYDYSENDKTSENK